MDEQEPATSTTLSSDRLSKKRPMPRRARQRKRPVSMKQPCNENLEITACIVPLRLPSSDGANQVFTVNSSGDSSPPPARGLVRIIQPYPWTFVTHAKQRWLNRTLLDVYSGDFGAYPSSYYETAIRQGRILVNDQVVDSTYLVQERDVLSHCVHRHEPAVAVAHETTPFISIVAETEHLLVVDKPSTLPIHPCGGYHKNTLIDILDTERGTKHFTIHRLDRLTSGLVLLGKTSAAAREWCTIIQERDHCEKLYLARVKGRFGTVSNIPTSLARSYENVPLYGEWVDDENFRTRNACSHWFTTLDGSVCSDLSMDKFGRMENSLEDWLDSLQKLGEGNMNVLNSKLRWLHLACPTRVEQHKNGICACGTFDELNDDIYRQSVKASETSFALIHYDNKTDSSLVLCRPRTGRSHQIRLHLQFLGSPICNDPNYGGTMWWNNPSGEEDCHQAQSILDNFDCVETTSSRSSFPCPAKQIEVDELNLISQCADEPLADFIQRTCVWCKRSRGRSVDRTLLEYLSRSPSIHLHAIQYTVHNVKSNETLSFRTKLPTWSQFH